MFIYIIMLSSLHSIKDYKYINYLLLSIQFKVHHQPTCENDHLNMSDVEF